VPTGFAAIILLAAVTGPASSQQARSPADPSAAAKPDGVEASPRGLRAVIRGITYGNWRKYCFKAAGTRTLCRTTIAGTFDTGQAAVRVDLIEGEGDDSARLQLFLPVGMYLPAGVKLTVDQGEAYQIPFTWCLTNACIAADLANQKFINAMETGRTLVLEVVDTNILSVTTSLPIDTFASVRHGPPAQTFDQAIDE
jgi:invasion protein IalB